MNNETKSSPGAAKAFGALLRFYRERAGISQEELGRKTGYSKSQVAMIERGLRQARGNFVKIADELLGAQGALLTVAGQVTASGIAAWFEDYLEEEIKAAGIHKYENHLIPGLLQTEEYARAVFVSERPALDDDEIEAGVTARIKRQRVFLRKPAPLITFVLEVAALTRPLGGRDVLRRNLQHVIEVGMLPHVEIQVMPGNRRIHAGLNGPFTLLETEKRQGQLVYVEGQGGRYFLSEQPDVGDVFARYSTLRAQALTPEESASLIEEVALKL
ncbi:helix-turn-helix domain-containing protein [Streptomyces sp. NPDC053253]|uniref:helix-turn-helix domain-containing protein n=1 Tax=Streptomyces sp. NPDC053253 TaxID=3365699 RepID=UPI0037D06F85